MLYTARPIPQPLLLWPPFNKVTCVVSIHTDSIIVNIKWNGQNDYEICCQYSKRCFCGGVILFTFEWTICFTGVEIAPAKGFGWHDPGFIHSAILTGLLPSSWHQYQYGRYHFKALLNMSVAILPFHGNQKEGTVAQKRVKVTEFVDSISHVRWAPRNWTRSLDSKLHEAAPRRRKRE